ncbi:MAG: hypothetical protein WCH10_02330 [bacterium]
MELTKAVELLKVLKKQMSEYHNNYSQLSEKLYGQHDKSIAEFVRDLSTEATGEEHKERGPSI